VAWGFFKKKPAPDQTRTVLWWRDAEATALRPTAQAIQDLRQDPADADLDEAERRAEMLEALDRLLELAALVELPVLDTQHRVIGTDRCHFIAPCSAPDHGDAAGKLLLTSHRIVFAGGASIAWPWHRVRRVVRHERDVIFEGGDSLALRLRCNSYGDALAAVVLSEKLFRKGA
jgi:hypothetical protein